MTPAVVADQMGFGLPPPPCVQNWTRVKTNRTGVLPLSLCDGVGYRSSFDLSSTPSDAPRLRRSTRLQVSRTRLRRWSHHIDSRAVTLERSSIRLHPVYIVGTELCSAVKFRRNDDVVPSTTRTGVDRLSPACDGGGSREE